MKHFTITAMAKESEHLADHPEVMAKELYWQGKRMPVKDQTPSDVVKGVVAAARVRRREPR